MKAVEFRSIAKKYGGAQVLKDVDLSVEAGTFTVVFGFAAIRK